MAKAALTLPREHSGGRSLSKCNFLFYLQTYLSKHIYEEQALTTKSRLKQNNFKEKRGQICSKVVWESFGEWEGMSRACNASSEGGMQEI